VESSRFRNDRKGEVASDASRRKCNQLVAFPRERFRCPFFDAQEDSGRNCVSEGRGPDDLFGRKWSAAGGGCEPECAGSGKDKAKRQDERHIQA
jgi:hypothetical protein